jgi:hypothetical protein
MNPAASRPRLRGAAIYLPVPIVPKDQLINERIGRRNIVSLLSWASARFTPPALALFFPALQINDRRSPHVIDVYCFGEHGCRRTDYAALVTFLTGRNRIPDRSSPRGYQERLPPYPYGFAVVKRRANFRWHLLSETRGYPWALADILPHSPWSFLPKEARIIYTVDSIRAAGEVKKT